MPVGVAVQENSKVEANATVGLSQYEATLALAWLNHPIWVMFPHQKR